MNYLLLIILLLVLVVPAAAWSLSILRIGTRSSKLAQAQAIEFQEVIQRADGRVMRTAIIPIDASGDKSKVTTQQTPLAIAGVDFTGTLDEALADGVVDVVVHSLKDIPPAHRWRINAENNIWGLSMSEGRSFGDTCVKTRIQFITIIAYGCESGVVINQKASTTACMST